MVMLSDWVTAVLLVAAAVEVNVVPAVLAVSVNCPVPDPAAAVITPLTVALPLIWVTRASRMASMFASPPVTV